MRAGEEAERRTTEIEVSAGLLKHPSPTQTHAGNKIYLRNSASSYSSPFNAFPMVRVARRCSHLRMGNKTFCWADKTACSADEERGGAGAKAEVQGKHAESNKRVRWCDPGQSQSTAWGRDRESRLDSLIRNGHLEQPVGEIYVLQLFNHIRGTLRGLCTTGRGHFDTACTLLRICI
jgi:hypothetical protein